MLQFSCRDETTAYVYVFLSIKGTTFSFEYLIWSKNVWSDGCFCVRSRISFHILNRLLFCGLVFVSDESPIKKCRRCETRRTYRRRHMWPINVMFLLFCIYKVWHVMKTWRKLFSLQLECDTIYGFRFL